MAKINSEIINRYYLKDSEEIELWKNSTFVFDTSALLQFYYYSDKAKKNIFDTTFETLSGRLWIPFHVAYEYQKNRKSAINKLFSERYDPLEKDALQGIQSHLETIGSKLDDFKNKIRVADTHPFIDSEMVDKFWSNLATFRDTFVKFEGNVKREFESRRSEINSMSDSDKDIVLGAIIKYFETGDNYNFAKTMEIVAEGEMRYQNQIPPGYKDSSSKEGVQKYGDLIIWKQIIDYAKTTSKSIIFVTNDVKEDWVYGNKDEKNRIERPREELIKEIYDQASVAFWMYTFSQFLYKTQERLNTQIDENVIEEVTRVNITQLSLAEYLSPLSPREKEVLEYVKRGLSNREIARSLGISYQTIKNHVTSILSKFGVETRTQAVVYALQNGWVKLEDSDEEEE